MSVADVAGTAAGSDVVEARKRCTVAGLEVAVGCQLQDTGHPANILTHYSQNLVAVDLQANRRQR